MRSERIRWVVALAWLFAGSMPALPARAEGPHETDAPSAAQSDPADLNAIEHASAEGSSAQPEDRQSASAKLLEKAAVLRLRDDTETSGAAARRAHRAQVARAPLRADRRRVRQWSAPGEPRPSSRRSALRVRPRRRGPPAYGETR